MNYGKLADHPLPLFALAIDRIIGPVRHSQHAGERRFFRARCDWRNRLEQLTGLDRLLREIPGIVVIGLQRCRALVLGFHFGGKGHVFARGWRRLDPTFAEQALNTADGVALHIQQVADGGQQREVFGAVVAATPTALQRLDLRELGFPEPQHVLGDVQLFGSFADIAERVVCLDHGLPLL